MLLDATLARLYGSYRDRLLFGTNGVYAATAPLLPCAGTTYCYQRRGDVVQFLRTPCGVGNPRTDAGYMNVSTSLLAVAGSTDDPEQAAIEQISHKCSSQLLSLGIVSLLAEYAITYSLASLQMAVDAATTLARLSSWAPGYGEALAHAGNGWGYILDSDAVDDSGDSTALARDHNFCDWLADPDLARALEPTSEGYTYLLSFCFLALRVLDRCESAGARDPEWPSSAAHINGRTTIRVLLQDRLAAIVSYLRDGTRFLLRRSDGRVVLDGGMGVHLATGVAGVDERLTGSIQDVGALPREAFAPALSDFSGDTPSADRLLRAVTSQVWPEVKQAVGAALGTDFENDLRATFPDVYVRQVLLPVYEALLALLQPACVDIARMAGTWCSRAQLTEAESSELAAALFLKWGQFSAPAAVSCPSNSAAELCEIPFSLDHFLSRTVTLSLGSLDFDTPDIFDPNASTPWSVPIEDIVLPLGLRQIGLRLTQQAVETWTGAVSASDNPNGMVYDSSINAWTPLDSGTRSPVSCCTISLDGLYAFIADPHGGLSCVRTDSRTQVWSQHIAKPITSIAYMAVERAVLAGCADGTLVSLRASNGVQITSAAISATAITVICPVGSSSSVAYVGDGLGHVTAYDASGPGIVVTWRAQCGPIVAIVIRGGHSAIVTCGQDGLLVDWDTDDYTVRAAYSLGGALDAAASLEDGRWIACTLASRHLVLIDTEVWHPRFTEQLSTRVIALASAAERTVFVSSHVDGTCREWPLASLLQGYLSDDFGRADSSDVGPQWSAPAGKWAIINNMLVSDSAPSRLLALVPALPPQYVVMARACLNSQQHALSILLRHTEDLATSVRVTFSASSDGSWYTVRVALAFGTTTSLLVSSQSTAAFGTTVETHVTTDADGTLLVKVNGELLPACRVPQQAVTLRLTAVAPGDVMTLWAGSEDITVAATSSEPSDAYTLLASLLNTDSRPAFTGFTATAQAAALLLLPRDDSQPLPQIRCELVSGGTAHNERVQLTKPFVGPGTCGVAMDGPSDAALAASIMLFEVQPHFSGTDTLLRSHGRAAYAIATGVLPSTDGSFTSQVLTLTRPLAPELPFFLLCEAAGTFGSLNIDPALFATQYDNAMAFAVLHALSPAVTVDETLFAQLLGSAPDSFTNSDSPGGWNSPFRWNSSATERLSTLPRSELYCGLDVLSPVVLAASREPSGPNRLTLRPILGM